MRLSERRLAEISIKLDLKADMSLEVHLSIVLYCGVDMLFSRHTCTKGGNLPFMYLHVRNYARSTHCIPCIPFWSYQIVTQSCIAALIHDQSVYYYHY